MSASTTDIARLSPTERTAVLRGIRQRLGASPSAAHRERPTRRPDNERPPATPVQHQLDYLHTLTPEVPNYTTAFAVELTGPLDERRLRRALTLSVEAHEALRTRLRRVDGQLIQDVAPRVAVEMPVFDYAEMSDTSLDPVRAAWALADTFARTPFDPSHGPLWQAALAVLNPQRTHHLMIWAASHSVFDGVSMGLLLTDLVAGYRSGQRPAPRLQLGDIARWEHQRLRGARRQQLLAYWRKQLDGMRALDFPLDHPRPRRPVLTGDAVYRPLDRALLKHVDAVAHEEQTTQFTVLLAAYHALLSTLTGCEDVAVGVPLDGRFHPDLTTVVGSLANTVVVRCAVSPDMSFAELVRRMRTVSVDAIEHQDMPLGQLVSELRPHRDGAAPPLVQTLFNYAGLPAAGQAVKFTDELTGWLHGVSNQAVRFDFEMSIDRTHDGSRIRFDYGTAVLERSSAERIVEGYLTLLRTAVASPDTPLAHIATKTGLTRLDQPSTSPPSAGTSSRGRSQPVTAITKVVASLWAEALGAETVPLDTDFFSLGGSSLLAVQLAEQITEQTGVPIPLIDLLTAESIQDLAAVIDRSAGPAATHPAKEDKS